jgi:hypothetical protein
MNIAEKNGYIQREYGSLIGKTISGVRALTEKELAEFMWHDGEIAVVLEFTDKTFAIVIQDDEGNGAGSLWLGQYAQTARQIALAD